MPTPNVAPALLAESATRIQVTYFVEPARMQRAVELVKRGAVRKMVKPENEWRVSSDQAPRGYWMVNDEQLACDCPDWRRHNLPGDESTFICKHLASVFLFLKVQAELDRRAHSPEATIPEIMQTLFGQPLKAAKAMEK